MNIKKIGKDILTESTATGCLVGGMIAGNVIIKMDKKGGLLFPGGLAVGGIIGASLLKNIYLKMILLGVSTYGAIKVINKISALEGTSTEGLAGFKLPDSVKTMLQKYIPNLGEIEAGGNYDYSRLLGDDLLLPEYAPNQIAVNGLNDAPDMYKLAG